MPGFWRIAIIEGDKERRHVGFAYHYGTRSRHVDTGIRERHVPGGTRPMIVYGEQVFYELGDALAAWKQEHPA